MFKSYSSVSRLRGNDAMRALVCETSIDLNTIIYPIFVRYGQDDVRPISSMPNQFQWTVDKLAQEIRVLESLGVKAVMPFGIPEHKDNFGADNLSPNGLMASAIKTIKDTCPSMLVVPDLCLCDYSSQGHCLVVNEDQSFDENRTLLYLQQAALNHAQAGADMIAPSGMVDKMVHVIRQALDENLYTKLPIMSYSAKFASSFYGPFREALDSIPQFGDRKTHQINPGNGREAIKEVMADIAEGADIVMVKPALAYLDVIKEISTFTKTPVAAYQVSGEYSMIHAAAARGFLDLKTAALESLVSIKRAGAQIVLTYFAKDLAEWLNA